MTDQQILQAAIDKALKNGYLDSILVEAVEIDSECNACYPGKDNATVKWGPYMLIFSHEFAKAFWGEEEVDCGCHGDERCVKCVGHWGSHELDYGWQFHLQQMVLCKNPIQYLSKFL